MKKTIAAALAVTLGFASLGALPASAQGIQFQFGNSQFGTEYRGDNGYRGRDRFERRGNYFYLNGYRGSRERRPGWRQYNGFYFPNSAFSITLQFGNANNNRRGWSQRHYAYCEDRYISYRASDNTFQPYRGGRQQCVSPFDR